RPLVFPYSQMPTIPHIFSLLPGLRPSMCGEAMLHRGRSTLLAAVPPFGTRLGEAPAVTQIGGGKAARKVESVRKSRAFPQIERQSRKDELSLSNSLSCIYQLTLHAVITA